MFTLPSIKQITKTTLPKRCILYFKFADTATVTDTTPVKQLLNSNLYIVYGKRNFTTYLYQKRVTHILCKNNSLKSVRDYNLPKYNSIFTSNKCLDDKHIDKELETIIKKYPNPKSVLHSYYTIVSNELHKNYQLTSQYKISPHRKGEVTREWTCTYYIKWPEEIKVVGTALSKVEASKKAAIKVLYLLDKANKILNNGQPVLYDRETFRKITKKNHVHMVLQPGVRDGLNQICDIYKQDLRQQVGSIKGHEEVESSEEATSKDALNEWRPVWARNESSKMYWAIESVELPIQAYRRELERLAVENRTVIVQGEPGCGKSTRVPQYLLEMAARECSMTGSPPFVVVTEPRRLAAITLASRVANERGELPGRTVAHSVRFSSNYRPHNCRLLYCTTGVLLRHLQQDPALSACTYVVVDEAHERDANTDLLLGLLRRALQLNPHLRLLVMSATMDSQLFSKYLGGAPVLHVPAVCHPVTEHFLEDVPLKLPLTLQAAQADRPPVIAAEEVAQVIEWLHKTRPKDGAVLCFLPGWDEISRVRRELQDHGILRPEDSTILPLHSRLSDIEQKRIFARLPSGIRKVVLATNVAETSVTVDDVVYVVDAGMQREPRYDPERGVTTTDVQWASQSAALQRRGRAGRTAPGECFHLYTRSRFDRLEPHPLPELLRTPLIKHVLDAKVYSGNEETESFFSTLICPPSIAAVNRAVNELKTLQLLDDTERITPLGKVVSNFALTPQLSVAMVRSAVYGCVTPLVTIASVFGGGPGAGVDMFSGTLANKVAVKNIKQAICSTSDHLAATLLYLHWEDLMDNEEYDKADELCIKNGLQRSKLNMLRRLQDLHFEYLETHLKDVMDFSDKYSGSQEIIKGVLLSAVDNILMRRNWDIVKGRLKAAQVYITQGGQKATVTPESVNSGKEKYDTPFLIYINETKSEIRRTMLIRETSLIYPLTLLLFKNGKLSIRKVDDTVANEIKTGVFLQFEGAKWQILCTEKEAILIQSCRNILQRMEQYFMKQLTTGIERNTQILEQWDRVLDILSKILGTKCK